MYCKECNSPISEGAKFCPICGTNTPYYEQIEFGSDNIVSNVDEDKDYKKIKYKREMIYNSYFDSKDRLIRIANYALIFAMICLCIKFVIDIYEVLGKYSEGIFIYFHFYYFDFVFEFIKNITILYVLRVLVYEVYFTIRNLFNNLKYEMFIKFDEEINKHIQR